MEKKSKNKTSPLCESAKRNQESEFYEIKFDAGFASSRNTNSVGIDKKSNRSSTDKKCFHHGEKKYLLSRKKYMGIYPIFNSSNSLDFIGYMKNNKIYLNDNNSEIELNVVKKKGDSIPLFDNYYLNIS